MLLEKYSPVWIKNFEDIKQELENGLGEIDFSIEHVGSTSVPNLDSKPIIDIDVIYSIPALFDEIKSALLSMGYYHNGNQGIEDRDVFKRSEGLNHEVLDKIRHHLYVCPKESKALERHILTRNALRRNDWARQEYQQRKYQLAERAYQDKKTYADLKEQFINDFIDVLVEKEKQVTN